MHLEDYLTRIGYTGPLDVNIETLAALHRAHLLAIPYENLDIHLGRYLTLDEPAIFEKLVTARRGGWCYEMNGLFAWALREIGFSVKFLAGAVNRPAQGRQAENNHLILLVELDRPYLADVGFGNGFLIPLPLEAGRYAQSFLSYQLSLEADRWFFQNHAHGGAGFDFNLEPHTLADFKGKCHELQTSPDSSFVRVTVCHRFMPQGIISLRGAILRAVTDHGVIDLTIEDEPTYRQVLRDQFDLQLPAAQISLLWSKVWPMHLEWLRAQNP
jgi:N-hydroxyarylamine O-acetyltransferase